jgi:hypothetical protein
VVRWSQHSESDHGVDQAFIGGRATACGVEEVIEEATNESDELTPEEFKSVLDDYRHAVAQTSLANKPEPLKFQVARMWLGQKINKYLSTITYE